MRRTLMNSVHLLSALPAFWFAADACSHDLDGKWALTISNHHHEVVTTAEVQFLPDRAMSCMAGEWMRVLVSSVRTSDETFFPAREPLSYKTDGYALTIGRNEICDNYLHLTGTLYGSPVAGNYREFGLGSGSTLGSFQLSRIE